MNEDRNGVQCAMLPVIPWTHEIPGTKELDRKGEVRITLTGSMGRIDRRMAPWP